MQFFKRFVLFLQRLTLKTVAVEQKNYQEYIGCFISKFSQILNAGFGMKVQIIPCSDKPNTFVRVDIVQGREIGAQVKEEEPFKKVFVDCGLDKYIQGAESINFVFTVDIYIQHSMLGFSCQDFKSDF